MTKKLQVEADKRKEELIPPSNIKREREEEAGEEGTAKKRRKTTNNEAESITQSNNSNNVNGINDSYAKFGESVANHLREANLSKGTLLILQGEILAAIAKHV